MQHKYLYPDTQKSDHWAIGMSYNSDNVADKVLIQINDGTSEARIALESIQANELIKEIEEAVFRIKASKNNWIAVA